MDTVAVETFPLRPLPGSSLDPRDVVGRDDVIREAMEQLRGGTNLLLSDPRRMGKTALLDRLCHLAGDGVDAIKIDYEGVTSVEEFVRRTMRGLKAHRGVWSRVSGAVTAYVKEVDLEQGGLTLKGAFVHKDPATLLTDVIDGVGSRIEEGRMLVIAMDEVPLAIDNILAEQGAEKALALLQALRHARRSHPRTVGWIVTGSIGFHHVLRRCGATEGVVNDLVSLPLGPLTEPDARFLARCLLLGIGHDANDSDVIGAMVRDSGRIPFLLHTLAHHVAYPKAALSADDITAAFEAFVDDRDQSRAVTHFLSRLDPNYGEHAPAAYQVLDALARDDAQTMDDLLNTVTQLASFDRERLLAVMDDLQDDHYLVRRSGSWQWRYPVLRRIWRRRRLLDP